MCLSIGTSAQRSSSRFCPHLSPRLPEVSKAHCPPWSYLSNVTSRPSRVHARARSHGFMDFTLYDPACTKNVVLGTSGCSRPGIQVNCRKGSRPPWALRGSSGSHLAASKDVAADRDFTLRKAHPSNHFATEGHICRILGGCLRQAGAGEFGSLVAPEHLGSSGFVLEEF